MSTREIQVSNPRLCVIFFSALCLASAAPAQDRSLVDLARGALRSITGWIGQYNRANYKVRTPLVTIGVRGTDHEPTHLLEGDPRGAPGRFLK